MLPFLSPALVRTSGPDTEHRLASALLRSGGLPLRGVCRHSQPAQALGEVLGALSGGVSGAVGLSLCCQSAADGDAQVLTVQYRAGLSFSVRRSQRTFDQCRPGVLGGLLSELRRAASTLAPVFTPEDALRDNPYGPVYGETEDLMDEAASVLRTQYAHLNEQDLMEKLGALQVRDAAKLMARHGRRTYLDESRLGFTLGAVFLQGRALDEAVSTLPAELKRAAARAREAVRHLQALGVLAPAWDDALDLDEYSDLRAPPFFVSQDASRSDPLAEHLEDLLQDQMNAGYEPWPVKALSITKQTSYRLVARQLTVCARALRLVRSGLRALGAQEVTP